MTRCSDEEVEGVVVVGTVVDVDELTEDIVLILFLSFIANWKIIYAKHFIRLSE